MRKELLKGKVTLIVQGTTWTRTVHLGDRGPTVAPECLTVEEAGMAGGGKLR